MKRWGNKPHNTVKLLVDASLTIYLLHHSIIVALGIVTAKTSFSPFAEWLGVMFATYALSLGGYMLICRVPFLFFCFNGQRLSNTRVRHSANVATDRVRTQ